MMMDSNLIVCPTEDYNCPYCNANGHCMMENPYEECDDYATIYEELFSGSGDEIGEWD